MPDPRPHTTSTRLDLPALANAAVGFLLATTFKRALSSMIALGAALLGLSWVDLVAMALQLLDRPPEAGGVTLLVQLVGIAMIAIGFGGHLALFVAEKREERQAAQNAQRGCAAALAGRLRVLIDGFRNPHLTKDAGYYNQEIVQTSRAAQAFLDIAPPEFKADRTLSALVVPKFDASKTKPLYDLELNVLEALADRIEAHYEIGSPGSRPAS